MADVLLRKQQRQQQRQQQLRHRSSSSHLDGDEGEGGEEASRRRVRTPSPTAASVQSLLPADASIVTTTRRRHRPKASIIVTTLFSILYFISLFTSKLDISLPSYIKSASESVHQLYRTSPEAQSYLKYLEELAHPTIHLRQYIMSRAASDIGDIGAVVGGVPPSPPTSLHPSPASPPQPLGPLDLLRKHENIKMFSEFHVKRHANYIAPASMDIKDIYNRQVWGANHQARPQHRGGHPQILLTSDKPQQQSDLC